MVFKLEKDLDWHYDMEGLQHLPQSDCGVELGLRVSVPFHYLSWWVLSQPWKSGRKTPFPFEL